MKIVSPSAEFVTFTPDLERVIERAGRVCYKSEEKITNDSAAAFIKRIRQSRHESVIEHGSITARFICDRGVSHELVRHRIASFSQESTRYCNYAQDKFGSEITVIKPCFWPESSSAYRVWARACLQAESAYFQLIEMGNPPQAARSVLPNSLKTEIVVTANPREWMHIFRMRCASDAHPQMREIMLPLQKACVSNWPAIFGDLF
ncbi:MAG: FAD-dependent thymidylate synthase [Alphaproteobacteria bacterium]|nr:FAD-dependent thymidylate synthase [Alphaproteobacteria bacterium]